MCCFLKSNEFDHLRSIVNVSYRSAPARTAHRACPCPRTPSEPIPTSVLRPMFALPVRRSRRRHHRRAARARIGAFYWRHTCIMVGADGMCENWRGPDGASGRRTFGGGHHDDDVRPPFHHLAVHDSPDSRPCGPVPLRLMRPLGGSCHEREQQVVIKRRSGCHAGTFRLWRRRLGHGSSWRQFDQQHQPSLGGKRNGNPG